MAPFLSIVIANYNYGRFLSDAIESVIAQGMGDQVELIICDGGSTDNSVEIIKKYACGLPPNVERREWEKTLVEDAKTLCSNQKGEADGKSIAGSRNCDHGAARGDFRDGIHPGLPSGLCSKALDDESCLRLFGAAHPLGPHGAFEHDPPAAIRAASERIERISNSQLTTHNSQLISWWCSEPDGGQSAAFNKGFSHARGLFLTWLNADDVMLPGTLRKLKLAVEQHPDCEWFVGGCFWLDKELGIVRMRRAQPFSRIRANAGVISVFGPSSFFSRRLFDVVGGVDERFCYAMDTDLWRKFHYIAGSRYRCFANYAWGLRLHEQAKMSAHMFAESGQKDPDHPKWKALKQEAAWMNEIHASSGKICFVKMLLSSCWMKSLLGRIDTWRFKGKKYLDFYSHQ